MSRKFEKFSDTLLGSCWVSVFRHAKRTNLYYAILSVPVFAGVLLLATPLLVLMDLCVALSEFEGNEP